MKNIFKDPHPLTPEQWEDGNYTIYRRFEFNSWPDVEVLMRLVKENIPNRGNSSYLRAKLLGILYSQYEKALAKFWIKRKYPKTWYVRYLWNRLIKKYHRVFKTKTFKNEVYLYNLAKEVIDEEKLISNIPDKN